MDLSVVISETIFSGGSGQWPPIGQLFTEEYNTRPPLGGIIINQPGRVMFRQNVV